VNKSELVARLTERLGGDRSIATAAVNGVLEEIEGSVARGERVTLIGFGTFDRRERAARTGRNPQTGATIQLGASVAPVFRPGAGFRSLLTQNGSSAAVPAVVPAAIAPKVAAPKKKSGKKAAAAAAAAAAKNAAKADTGKNGKKTPKKATGKDAKKAAKKAR
jgi:DNA-binding protein HU-beta